MYTFVALVLALSAAAPAFASPPDATCQTYSFAKQKLRLAKQDSKPRPDPRYESPETVMLHDSIKRNVSCGWEKMIATVESTLKAYVSGVNSTLPPVRRIVTSDSNQARLLGLLDTECAKPGNNSRMLLEVIAEIVATEVTAVSNGASHQTGSATATHGR